MKHICRAVLILEEECSIPAGRKPLMLETFLHRPLMERAAAQCLADGVQRFFIVCPPRFAAEAAACFPEGTAVTVSEQHAELLDFLDTDETTLVLCRAAVPYAEANAVSGAELVPGWLPVFGPETVRELETALADTEKSL